MKHAKIIKWIDKEEIVDLLYQFEEADVIDIIRTYNDYSPSENFQKAMYNIFKEAMNDNE